MPAATEPFTTAGTEIRINTTLRTAGWGTYATEVIAGPFTDIGEITDAGEFGRQYNLVTHNPIGDRRTVKRKGSYNDGQLTLQLARVPADAGQALLISALDSDIDQAIEVELQDGTKLNFAAQVLSYTTNLGSVDQITGATVILEVTNDIIETAPA